MQVGSPRRFPLVLCECGLPCRISDTSDIDPARPVVLYRRCGSWPAANCGSFEWMEAVPRAPSGPVATAVAPSRKRDRDEDLNRVNGEREHSDGNPSAVFDYVMKRKQDLIALPTCKCPVCLSVMVDPRATACEHSFCYHCLLRLVQEVMPCPVCRRALQLETIREADVTLCQLLDEFEVYCTHKSQGCMWTGPRSNLPAHCEKDCKFSVPLPKIDWDMVQHCDAVPIHRFCICHICTRPMINPVTAKKCEHSFCQHCIVTLLGTTRCCPVCGAPLQRADLERADKTLRGLLAELVVLCPNAPGCGWKGARTELDAHFRLCASARAAAAAAAAAATEAAAEPYPFSNVSTE